MKYLKRGLSVMLVIAMVLLLTVQPQSAWAASKKIRLSEDKLVIPIGKEEDGTYWNSETEDITFAKKIQVVNGDKGVTYYFESDNKQVVDISRNGGYPEGIKSGKAKIICYKIVKGKKKTVAKCKVTVMDASFQADWMEEDEDDEDESDWEEDEDWDGDEIVLGESGVFPKGTFVVGGAEESEMTLLYRNPEATYSYECDNPGLEITERKIIGNDVKKYTEEKVKYIYIQTAVASKSGIYQLTVKETVQGKTRKLNDQVQLKVSEKEGYTVDVPLGQSVFFEDLAGQELLDGSTFSVISGNDIISVNTAEKLLVAIKEGIAVVEIKNPAGRVIRTVKVFVIVIPCEKLRNIPSSAVIGIGENTSDAFIDFMLEPSNTTDKVVISSSDPTIYYAEVCYEDGEFYIEEHALKPGTVTVTVTCGTVTATCVVTVEP